MKSRRKKRIKNKAMTLGEIGFAMRVEASKASGGILIVEKKLWTEIAALLIDTDKKLALIEKELTEFAGEKQGCFDCDECEYIGEGSFYCMECNPPVEVIEDFGQQTENWMHCLANKVKRRMK